MSKLVDKLNQASRAAPQPMGFGRAQPASARPNMVLIASLSLRAIDRLADCVTGADAGVWHIATGADIKSLSEKAHTIPDIPWGYWLTGGSPEELESIARTGLDFVIFPATTPLAILQDSEAGRILQVGASLPEGLLRTINGLPIDAVLVTGDQEPGNFLTWHHLLLCQRFASVLDKPLLVTLPPEVTDKELQALLEAGVSGVIIEAAGSQTSRLRQQIDKLTAPRRRRRREPLVPRIAPEPEPVTEEEEEEP